MIFFHQQAIVTCFLLTLLAIAMFWGTIFARFHRWTPARVVGGIVAFVCWVLFVAHIVALFAR